MNAHQRIMDRQKREAEGRHDHETEARQDPRHGETPCAVCGQRRGAAVHQ